MQTPKRKSGKYAQVKVDPHITAEKLKSLKAQLVKLRKDQKMSSKEVARLAEFGDFSENHAYQMEKGRLRGINQRILETEDLIARAIIIKPSKARVVQLGSTVTIHSDNEERMFTILGSAETDPSRGIISHQSPLGLALLGKGVGATVQVQQGDARIAYIIKKIT